MPPTSQEDEELSHWIHVRHRPSGDQRFPLPGDHGTLVWNSRSHRKGRRPRWQPPGPQPARHLRTTPFRWWGWEPGNLSWWVGFLFTVGSVVWLLNGSLLMWPVAARGFENWSTSLSAFVGGSIFLIGAYAALAEVFHRCPFLQIQRKKDRPPEIHLAHHPRHRHPQGRRRRLFAWELESWAWWLNAAQMVGATVFLVACAAGLLLPAGPSFPERPWYWDPQMIGASFFLLASLMAMIEAQEKPWKPAWKRIGWHAALFNGVGAIGFFLCAWYGANTSSPTTLYWGSTFSTFWGSLAFLLASYLMLLEALNP
jgi:hypothetical protein